MAQEADLWLSLPAGGPLPVDRRGGPDVEGSARTVTVELGPQATSDLVNRVPRSLGAGVQEALLDALAQAFAGWTGEPSLLVDLEGHGREDIFEDVDLTRTTGWFTSLYPVLLTAAGEGAEARLPELAGRLRRIPAHGIGYGVLRHLRGDARLAQLRAEVSFNYLGRAGDGLQDLSLVFRPVSDAWAADAAGNAARSPRNRRRHPIEVLAEVSGGRLRTGFRYSVRRHRAATIEALAAGYRRTLEETVDRARRAGPPPATGVVLEGRRLQRLLSEITG
jgi:non-ribosomal peptide synthase protein (TIGR01720 family)